MNIQENTAPIGAAAAPPASIAVGPIGAENLDTSGTWGSRPRLHAVAPTGAYVNRVYTALRR